LATYHIEPERRTLHGHFSRDLSPILSIDPGDTVVYRTLDAGWTLEPEREDGTPRRHFEPRDKDLDSGHALCGPVEIRGAKPGMTLEIAINRIVPGPFGWTWAGDWPSDGTDPFGLHGKEAVLYWTLDRETMTGRDRPGHTIALHPFMGVMGMPPNEPGVHITAPPRPCGGNIDCKELVQGSTLYLPISVPGALFSVGDGHAAQGDGEVSSTAIECPMDVVDLTFRLRDDMYISTPRANTPAGWITLAFHEDLNVATRVTINAMLGLMAEQYKVERAEALALASVVVDMHITQIVNGVSGVHAILPHNAIR
jgi:acetamidase/formamidase